MIMEDSVKIRKISYAMDRPNKSDHRIHIPGSFSLRQRRNWLSQWKITNMSSHPYADDG